MTGTADGRTDDRQITLFDSVGFAIEDFSASMRLIHHIGVWTGISALTKHPVSAHSPRFIKRAIEGTDFFEPLDMLADPDDPRNLFGMLMRAKS